MEKGDRKVMAIETKGIVSDILIRGIQAAIEEEIKQRTEIAIEKAKERLDLDVADIVASVVIRIFRLARFETFGSELRISVNMEERKETGK